MGETILVAYASKYGSTQEVAESIAATLREHELAADCRPAHDVRELDGYDAVVLGGGLYAGRLHKDARRFLKRYRSSLRTLPFAVFAMGPDDLSAEKVAQSRVQLERALAREPELDPVAVAIFGGVIDPDKLHFPFSRMPAVDARDWEAIHAWAESVAARLCRAPAAVGSA